MTALLIATRNAHKVGEISAILAEEFKYLTLADFVGSPNVVEDAPTFEGNARKKAVEIARWFAASGYRSRIAHKTFVIADDSGLEVDALQGAPGVQSARFAALDTGTPGNSSDADNNAKLLRLLVNVPGPLRTARFRCVIALTRVPESGAECDTRIFEGACEGRIGFEPQGGGGFGYDPLFYPLGYEKSFAVLPRAQKNVISHRARALANLKTFLRRSECQ
jgi:XTP/dITP diphosphohydrolase